MALIQGAWPYLGLLFSPPMGGTSLNALKLLSPAPCSKFWGFLSGMYVLGLRSLNS